ncbi:ArsR/SmtB family transcription factor [Chiayiivirga flava]|uniref:DNA-binding transcriptional ArsR family regulator n=1 Tax=Chiayiivirga flava TaxID=659595 RepID=A0A7W8D6E9_9GAMM|nr:metalloregulator ArsR/SmtB family transcription factor [Chiayiivirga flava]MBB5207645.1 DNA-binding transcriptional ArsR family regulator [Chiayiivirga flava]
MVESIATDRLDAVFHALADPTRRAMLQRLATREHNVGDLAAPFAMSLAAASKHIQVLERAGLVQREVQGRRHICRLDAAPLHRGVEWLRHYERFWNARLDALDALLRAEDAAANPAGKAGTRKSAASGNPARAGAATAPARERSRAPAPRKRKSRTA